MKIFRVGVISVCTPEAAMPFSQFGHLTQSPPPSHSHPGSVLLAQAAQCTVKSCLRIFTSAARSARGADSAQPAHHRLPPR
jgi:hypothetical protein